MTQFRSWPLNPTGLNFNVVDVARMPRNINEIVALATGIYFAIGFGTEKSVEQEVSHLHTFG